MNQIFVMVFIFAVATHLKAQSPGSLDSSFGIAGKVNTVLQPEGFFGPSPSLLQADGKIIMSMGITVDRFLREGAVLLTARYLSNGSLDSSWGQNGISTFMLDSVGLLAPRDMSLTPDGGIILPIMRTRRSAQGNIINPMLLKYKNDGTLDPNFGNQGIYNPPFFYPRGFYFSQITLQGQRILCFASFLDTTYIVAHHLQTGQIDSSWGNQGTIKHYIQSSPSVNGLAEQEQKILFLTRDEVSRYFTNGSLDTSFGMNNQGFVELSHIWAIGYTPFSLALSDLVVQDDQKFLVGGVASPTSIYAGKSLIERYLPHGVLDTSFANNGVCVLHSSQGVFEVVSLAVQENGCILAGGQLLDTVAGGYRSFALMRYDSTGQVDSTFGNNGLSTTKFHPSDTIETVYNLMIQPDTKIILTGKSSLTSQAAPNGLPLLTFNLVRYHGDSLATTSTEQVAPASHIQLQAYPNPAKEHLHTSFTIEQPGRIELALYDTQGRKVQSLLQDQREAGEHQESFQLDRGLAAGLYVLKLQTEQSYFAQIVVIQ